jgi:endonuclease G
VIMPFTMVLLSAALSISTAFAAQTNCPEHFVNGQAPDLINQKLSVKARDVCYSGFSLKHSGITRTPIYSAEHLTRDRLAMAKGMKRSSKFYPDPNIPASERAELHHYAKSGFDRGHVAPQQICLTSNHSRSALHWQTWCHKNLQ